MNDRMENETAAQLDHLLDAFMAQPNEHSAQALVDALRATPLYVLCPLSWTEEDGAFSARDIEEKIENGQAKDLPIYTIMIKPAPAGALIPLFTDGENSRHFEEEESLYPIEVSVGLIRSLLEHLPLLSGVVFNPREQALILDRQTYLTVFREMDTDPRLNPDTYLSPDFEDVRPFLDNLSLEKLREQAALHSEIQAAWLLVNNDPNLESPNWLIVLDSPKTLSLDDYRDLVISFMRTAGIEDCAICYTRTEGIAPLIEELDPLYVRLLN